MLSPDVSLVPADLAPSAAPAPEIRITRTATPGEPSQVWEWEGYKGRPMRQFMASEEDMAAYVEAVLPRLVAGRVPERVRAGGKNHPMRCRRRPDRERGSAVIEAVIGVPAFMLFVALIVFAGRVAIAHQGVQSAAADAARSASIARTQGGAQTEGNTAAATSLANQHVNCVTTTVSVDTSGFASPVGTPAKVSATVTCDVNLSDLFLPGVPGSKAITATMSSPLDTYRER